MQPDTISYRFTADEWALLGRYCDLDGFPIPPAPEADPERARPTLEEDGILITIGPEARLDALVYKLLAFCGSRETPRLRVSDDTQTFHLILGKALALLAEEAPEGAVVLTPYPAAERLLEDLRARIRWPAKSGAGELRGHEELAAAVAACQGAKED